MRCTGKISKMSSPILNATIFGVPGGGQLFVHNVKIQFWLYLCAQFEIRSYNLTLTIGIQNDQYNCHHKGSVVTLFSGKNKITNKGHGA